jgi:hypothetical protein
MRGASVPRRRRSELSHLLSQHRWVWHAFQLEYKCGSSRVVRPSPSLFPISCFDLAKRRRNARSRLDRARDVRDCDGIGGDASRIDFSLKAQE